MPLTSPSVFLPSACRTTHYFIHSYSISALRSSFVLAEMKQMIGLGGGDILLYPFLMALAVREARLLQLCFNKLLLGPVLTFKAIYKYVNAGSNTWSTLRLHRPFVTT